MKIKIQDLAFGDRFKFLEVTLNDGTEANIPASEICEGQEVHEDGTYYVTEHDDDNPIRVRTHEDGIGYVWEDVTIEKGAYETLDDFTDEEIIDLAIKYAGETSNIEWTVRGTEIEWSNRIIEKTFYAKNFTHLTFLLRGWKEVVGISRKQVAEMPREMAAA